MFTDAETGHAHRLSVVLGLDDRQAGFAADLADGVDVEVAAANAEVDLETGLVWVEHSLGLQARYQLLVHLNAEREANLARIVAVGVAECMVDRLDAIADGTSTFDGLAKVRPPGRTSADGKPTWPLSAADLLDLQVEAQHVLETTRRNDFEAVHGDPEPLPPPDRRRILVDIVEAHYLALVATEGATNHDH
ncbi:MAG: hypothetical protein K1X38_17860 [Microthrixaceae bacterium]|nr:hypothetical protein [Microthrixaceae bacterium]